MADDIQTEQTDLTPAAAAEGVETEAPAAPDAGQPEGEAPQAAEDPAAVPAEDSPAAAPDAAPAEPATDEPAEDAAPAADAPLTDAPLPQEPPEASGPATPASDAAADPAAPLEAPEVPSSEPTAPAEATDSAPEPTEPSPEPTEAPKDGDEDKADAALGEPGATAPGPEEGKPGVAVTDQPAAPTAAATSGSITPPSSGGATADQTVEDKDQAIYQPVQGDTSITTGAGGKSIQVGDEHVAAGYDSQVFNAASASQAARGVPWEVFVKLEGIALEQAAALASLVRKKHCGHHKSEKEWRQITTDFYARDDQGDDEE